MHICKNCKEELPVLKAHRTWVEKYITHRHKFKYRCEQCNEITFIDEPNYHSYLIK